ncbi:hypothetical protein GEMRC1_008021 [Eukaryota sp. GEM-RC1]
MNATSSLLTSPPLNKKLVVTTSCGDSYTGFLHCIDSETGFVVLMTSIPNPSFSIVKLGHIHSVEIEHEERPPLHIPLDIDMKEVTDRISQSLALAEQELRNTKAVAELSPRGRKIYEKFSSLFDTSLNDKTITVLNMFYIVDPYTRALPLPDIVCDAQQLNRINTMLRNVESS